MTSARRFFVPRESIKGNSALITGQEAHHILNVLRLKKGQRLEIFDGRGLLYQGVILATQPKKIKMKIERKLKDSTGTKLEIALVCALPKKNKMDDIVEKATELGVDVIIPTQTARTIVKLNQAKRLSRKMRWQRIATEAAKQCARTTIPRISDLAPWPDVISCLGDFDLKLLFSLAGKPRSLKAVLCRQNSARGVAIFIGPEGDFTAQEVHQAEDLGCTIVSLGKTVLKSDTAAVSALAMINYELKS